LHVVFFSLFDEYNIEVATIEQSASDWRKILVLGTKAQQMKTDLSSILKDNVEFSKFEITLLNDSKPFTMKPLKLDKSDTQIWTEPIKQTTCEIFVIAEKTNGKKFSKCKRVFAVSPAHLVLSDDQNRNAAAADSSYIKKMSAETKYNLKFSPLLTNCSRQTCRPLALPCNAPKDENCNETDDPENDHTTNPDVDSDEEETSNMSAIRKTVESKSTRRSYFIQEETFGGRVVDLEHPILLGYRHWYYRLSSSDSKEENPLADICPEIKCGELRSVPTCPHIFMNDIALFPIDFKDAEFCNEVLRKKRDLSKNLSHELLEIYTEEQLTDLLGKEMMVKGIEGRVVLKSCIKPGQGLGNHICFSLTTTDSAGKLM